MEISPEPMTASEMENMMQAISAHMKSIAAFEKHEIDTCPNCDGRVTALDQVGRCVYAEPCGCRLWQGTIPEAWR